MKPDNNENSSVTVTAGKTAKPDAGVSAAGETAKPDAGVSAAMEMTRQGASCAGHCAGQELQGQQISSGKAACFTAAELQGVDLKDLPMELVSARHLIYSSPATLAFNSPGAEGYGVKRAGLAVPDSVMLIVSPGCCGRNTSLISAMPAYKNRFFYLTLDDNDIVTGKHLKRIPQAVTEIVEHLENLPDARKPKLVMICITCVDALLGTDMERVCKKAEAASGVLVRPCYMYALTREGRRPPMVHVRQSIYSLLTPQQRVGSEINYLGFFSSVSEDFELTGYLKKSGIKVIRQLGTCADYEEFQQMSRANFNLVLNPEARYAAQDFKKNLNIPSVELTRFYEIDRIHKQYKALEKVLGITIDDQADYDKTKACIDAFIRDFGHLSVVIGECLNADSFELALALTGMGMKVNAIYGTLSSENKLYLDKLADSSPDTRVYSNMEPTMIYYGSGEVEADIALGKDAGYYHPDVCGLDFNADLQPYGYAAVRQLLDAMREKLTGEHR